MLKTEILCKFPITFLQDHLYGICSNDLIIIACDSGVGKSTISRLITRQARDEGCPVVLYSLENAPGSFVTEEVMLDYCKDTGDWIDNRQFEIDHTLHPEKYTKYREQAYEKSLLTDKNGLPLLVFHEQVAKGDWNIYKLIKSMKEEIDKGYRLFVIDHLDVLVQKDELSDTKQAMDELWYLVQEYHLAIVTFSQIVKGCSALCPSYDDLRGHKAKVYKSTIIITLARHEYGYYLPPVKFPKAKPTYIRIAKSRNTNTACAICYYNNGYYLETYTDVLCDTHGTFIDGMTRDKLQRFKRQQDQKEEEWK